MMRAKNQCRSLSPALAALIAGVGVSPVGCVILPPVPAVAPGYGRACKVVGEEGHPVESGLLALRSVYEMAPDMVNVYDITNGQVTVPCRTAVRYGDSVWGLYCSTVPFGYFGWFHNPNYTEAVVLADGYVPGNSKPIRGRWGYDFPSLRLGGQDRLPDQIGLERADEAVERKWLECCREEFLSNPDGRSTEDDKKSRRRISEYIDRRLGELPKG
jgi:hypothetical protein